MRKILTAVAVLGLVLGSTAYASATGNHHYDDCVSQEPTTELQVLTYQEQNDNPQSNHNNNHRRHHKHHKKECQPEKVDVCLNIEGVQETIPEGMVVDAQGTCTEQPEVPQTPPTETIPEPTPSVEVETVVNEVPETTQEPFCLKSC